jgi:predicted ATPase/DNA-binding SARP family transcriptional activator/Flp pilus assembly protein TadD
MSYCRIELLGELRLLRGEEIKTRFVTTKAGVLLAYLALRHPRAQSREHLIDLLWPEMEIDAGRNNLSTLLSLLRRDLEPPGTPAGTVLQANRQSVQLNPDSVTTDLHDFDRLWETAAKTDQVRERLVLLQQAITLYRGELLTGFYEEWVFPVRTHYHDRALRGLHHLCRLQANTGALESALESAERVLQWDACSEIACRQKMLLLARLGRPAAALDAYAQLTKAMESQLGVTPEARTRALAEKIRHDPHALVDTSDTDEPEPDGVSEADGEGNSRAVSVGNTRSSETSPSSPSAVLVQEHATTASPVLPIHITRFIGRKRECEQLTTMLCDPAVRLVTLIGPGGVGKTRLGVEAARLAASHFGGRVWFVPLADIASPALIVSTLLRVLGSSPSTPNPIEAIVTTLTSAPALLLLDNMEHLLPVKGLSPPSAEEASEGGQAMVRLLLERVPTLTCLVTSRRTLLLEGEQVVTLSSLGLPAAESQGVMEAVALPSKRETLDLESLRECDSVALYLDRAHLVKADFALTAHNAGAVADLCRKLDGLPLAIEMVAAWVKTLPPARVLERLEHQLDLLVSRRRDLTPRHQSLRATCEWSFALLTSELQGVFARLSVFRGGWTLAAGEAVCGEDALFALDHLQEASLIQALETEEEDEERSRLLEPLREFAREQLQARGEEQEALRSHAEYYLGFAQQATSYLEGPQQKVWLDRLEADHDNIRAALQWAEIEDPVLHLRLSTVLRHFWIKRGYCVEGQQYLERALILAVGSNAERASGCYSAGLLALENGEYLRAYEWHEKALTLYREQRDAENAADVVQAMGMVRFYQEDFQAAVTLFRQAAATYRALGLPKQDAHLSNNIGMTFVRMGDYEQARRCFEQFYEVCCEAGNPQSIAGAMNNLAHVTWRTGDSAEARRLLERSLAIARELGMQRDMYRVLHELGIVACLDGNMREARSFFREGLDISLKIAYKRGLVKCLSGLAVIAAIEQDHRQAASLLGALQEHTSLEEILVDPLPEATPHRLLHAASEALGEAVCSAVQLAGRARSLSDTAVAVLQSTTV